MMIMIRVRSDNDIDYLMKVMMNLMIMIMTQVTEKSNDDNAGRDWKVKVGAPPTIKVTQGIPLLMMTMMLVMMLTMILILMMMTVMNDD